MTGRYIGVSHAFVADMLYKWTSSLSTRLELQYLTSKDDQKDWMAGLLEVNFAPHWSVFASDYETLSESGDKNVVADIFTYYDNINTYPKVTTFTDKKTRRAPGEKWVFACVTVGGDGKYALQTIDVATKSLPIETSISLEYKSI